MKNIYIDIDGTLTNNGEKPYGQPLLDRVDKVRELSIFYNVFIWSGNGFEYAKEFVANNCLSNCIALGKPHIIIDDNPTIRPHWDELIHSPEYLDRQS